MSDATLDTFTADDDGDDVEDDSGSRSRVDELRTEYEPRIRSGLASLRDEIETRAGQARETWRAEYEPRIRAALSDAEDWLDERYADASERRTRFYQGLVALGLVVAWTVGKPAIYGWLDTVAVIVTVGPFLWFATESEMWSRLAELTALIAVSLLAAILAKATIFPWRSVEAFVTETVVGRAIGVTFGTAVNAALALFGAAALFWLLKAYEYRRTSPEDRVLTDGSGEQ
ncbi:hypothetical protein [Halorussus marinus]|uniref:hypothetical protein n=1 Tax=Halorussus marinus TaxID=2505976 RepID=UPI0010923651|nr:hypothetical protein [Halorussus marinus]